MDDPVPLSEVGPPAVPFGFDVLGPELAPPWPIVPVEPGLPECVMPVPELLGAFAVEPPPSAAFWANATEDERAKTAAKPIVASFILFPFFIRRQPETCVLRS